MVHFMVNSVHMVNFPATTAAIQKSEDIYKQLFWIKQYLIARILQN